jgi:hypothetical protein
MITSDFGKGFIYNLVLFCKHHDKALILYDTMLRIYPGDEKKAWEMALPLWFNGAGDHFYEFTVPDEYKDKPIGKLAEKLRREALGYRMIDKVTRAKFEQFHHEVEKLAMLIDKELGIKVVKAEWS